jgi:hypothetical protein
LVVTALKPIELIHTHSLMGFVEASFLFIVPFILFGLFLNRKQAYAELMKPGLFGIIGMMGAGKSYFMTAVAWYAHKNDRLVFANYDLKGQVDYATWDSSGRPGHRFVRVTNWTQIRSIPDKSIVLIDEAHIWWGSNDYKAPPEQRQWITQLRKHKITCIWASQDISFVARWLRLLSFGVWIGARWRTGHIYKLYQVAQIGAGGKATSKSELTVTLRRARKIMKLYDTFQTVDSSIEWGGVDEVQFT